MAGTGSAVRPVILRFVCAGRWMDRPDDRIRPQRSKVFPSLAERGKARGQPLGCLISFGKQPIIRSIPSP
jgi:hypothetical protein